MTKQATAQTHLGTTLDWLNHAANTDHKPRLVPSGTTLGTTLDQTRPTHGTSLPPTPPKNAAPEPNETRPEQRDDPRTSLVPRDSRERSARRSQPFPRRGRLPGTTLDRRNQHLTTADAARTLTRPVTRSDTPTVTANGSSAKSRARATPARITRADRSRFLDLIRDGKNRSAAAHELELSARRLRAMCNSKSSTNYDPVFAAAYEAAVEEGRPAMVEDLDRQWVERAREDNRLFALRLEAFHPALEHRRLRHSRVEHSGGLTVGLLDLSRYTDEELEMLIALHAKGRAEPPAPPGGRLLALPERTAAGP